MSQYRAMQEKAFISGVLLMLMTTMFFGISGIYVLWLMVQAVMQ
jgi:hypothetical protein